MKVFDALLIAPTLFCMFGALVGAFTDIRVSRMWIAVAAASCLSLLLHWVLTRAQRQARARQWAASATPAPETGAEAM